jgi:hypothetical protein
MICWFGGSEVMEIRRRVQSLSAVIGRIDENEIANWHTGK